MRLATPRAGARPPGAGAPARSGHGHTAAYCCALAFADDTHPFSQVAEA